MKRVPLDLSEDLLARVDEAAGDVPRNRWIRRAIERELRREDHERRLPGTADEQPPRSKGE